MGQIPYVALTLPMLPYQNTPTNVALCNNRVKSLYSTYFTNVAQQNHKKNPNVAIHLKDSCLLLQPNAACNIGKNHAAMGIFVPCVALTSNFLSMRSTI
jgi:hypothetical protein